MSENRNLLTLSVLSAGAGLVSGTLLLLQATTVWVSPPTNRAPAAIQIKLAPSDTDAVAGSVAATIRLHEIAPLPEPNFSPASLDEPVYTASAPAKAESAEDTPLASHESEISPPQPEGVSTNGAEDATEVAANPPAREVGDHRTEAQATDTKKVSEPIKQASESPSTNADQRAGDSDQARAEETQASEEPASSPSPSARPAPKRFVQADKHELAGKAKPQWKPMALAPNEKLAQPASPAKRLSSASYDSKIWAALARHKPRTTQRQSASVSFAIAASGRLRFVKVTGSSGDSRLDKLAIAIVRKAAPFPPPPAGSPSYTIRIYVR